MFSLWQYHYSNIQTVKYICITLYTYIVYCTIGTRAQSVRKQHEKRTSKKSEMVTYKDSTQVAKNIWVSFIYSKPLGKMGYNMLKWPLIYKWNKLTLCLYKAELCFKVIERNYIIAANINFGHWFDCHKFKFVQKYGKIWKRTCT